MVNAYRQIGGLSYYQANENTLILQSSVFNFDKTIQSELISLATSHDSGTSRICLHGSTSETTQNMIICILANKTFTRHFHPSTKKESYTVLLGTLYVILYDESGNYENTLELNTSNTPYMHSGGKKHLPYTNSSICIYQEVYHGSFDKAIDVINF